MRENHGPSMRQMKMWKDFERLMECKTHVASGVPSGVNVGQSSGNTLTFDHQNEEDRLIL